jgi:axial budding pattern protein 2
MVVYRQVSLEIEYKADDSSGRITGKTPDEFINGTVTPLAVPLTIASTNASNTLELVAYIGLDILAYPFTTLEFPNVTAKPGSVFEFDLSPYVQETTTPLNMTVLAATASINTTVFPTEAAQWLTFHEGNLTLEGDAPQSPGYDHVEVEFTAGQTGNIATSTLTIAMEGVTNSPPTRPPARNRQEAVVAYRWERGSLLGSSLVSLV